MTAVIVAVTVIVLLVAGWVSLWLPIRVAGLVIVLLGLITRRTAIPVPVTVPAPETSR